MAFILLTARTTSGTRLNMAALVLLRHKDWAIILSGSECSQKAQPTSIKLNEFHSALYIFEKKITFVPFLSFPSQPFFFFYFSFVPHFERAINMPGSCELTSSSFVLTKTEKVNKLNKNQGRCRGRCKNENLLHGRCNPRSSAIMYSYVNISFVTSRF